MDVERAPTACGYWVPGQDPQPTFSHPLPERPARKREKTQKVVDTGPGFDANLELAVLWLRHGLSGEPQLVEPAEAGQHHSAHLLGIPEAVGAVAALSRLLAGLLLDHLLRLLRLLYAFLGHGARGAAGRTGCGSEGGRGFSPAGSSC